MKRLTTFLLLFSSASLLWAQTTANCIEWIKDDSPNTDFKAIYTFGADYITYDISQPAQEYNPIGFKFISSGKSTEQAVLDMSSHPKVSFTLENTSSSLSTIEAQVYLEDINGITLKFDSTATVDGDLYQYMIGATMDGKYGTDYEHTGIATKSIEPSETFDFEYDFSNATAVDYLFNPDKGYECNNLPGYLCNNGTGGDCFDYTKVVGVYIIIINNDNGQYSIPEECYTKEAFEGIVKISNIEVYGVDLGDYYGTYPFQYYEECDKILSNESADIGNNYLNIYPNPATETVNFNTHLTNVEVYNTQGALVETLSSANALNVSSYEAGVYFIKATEGTSRVVVK